MSESNVPEKFGQMIIDMDIFRVETDSFFTRKNKEFNKRFRKEILELLGPESELAKRAIEMFNKCDKYEKDFQNAVLNAEAVMIFDMISRIRGRYLSLKVIVSMVSTLAQSKFKPPLLSEAQPLIHRMHYRCLEEVWRQFNNSHPGVYEDMLYSRLGESFDSFLSGIDTTPPSSSVPRES